jgi:hypothetical protein
MVDLDFSVEGATVERHAVAPLLLFALRVTNRTPALPVQNVALHCQIRIEPTRRQYGAGEQERLVDLFGEAGRWGETLHSFLWTHTGASIPAFDTQCQINLPVPCSYDFNIAATKYFYGLEGGEVPLVLFFTGTVFFRDAEDRLQLSQIPWNKEASWRLPVQIWQAMMDHYYPNSAWLRLERDVFEQLYRFKRQKGFPTIEQTLESLLRGASLPGASSEKAP